MKPIYLTFGIDEQDQWCSIENVPSGQTSLRCPWCKQKLVAKKGQVKVHHFSHTSQTCRVSQDAVLHTQLPTFDTFDLLDKHEKQYLERRAKYKSHQKVFPWSGMNSAVDRLEAMGVLSVERSTDDKLEVARSRLKTLSKAWLDSSGRPSKELTALIHALEPIADVQRQWDNCLHIESTEIDKRYNTYQLSRLKTISELDKGQRYWFDAFWRRQSLIKPDYIELLRQKFYSLNSQSLYVMRITGDFHDLPPTIIKVGISTRKADVRLKEVISSLKPYGSSIHGEVLVAKEFAGRLEHLIHRLLRPYNLEIGAFTEFFSADRLDWLLSEIHKADISQYSPPEMSDVETERKTGGRRKKTNAELLAEYEHVVTLIRSGKGIRETSRIAKCSVNTVQKVKAALLNET
ncbi:GIY-YIG nuclease family protein [Marinomonas algarum]|uniref:GIY-YIG nuclease family protein n=1 Tax=Marinomonas algarum TaxID=2883105 RepID=A0A9X1LF98_9GAMM|nr:GIY-YIG nuclease family protein [Marinomonas algarum]MCB5162625.1 hypothetical protein [Marinomonas algarum]